MLLLPSSSFSEVRQTAPETASEVLPCMTKDRDLSMKALDNCDHKLKAESAPWS